MNEQPFLQPSQSPPPVQPKRPLLVVGVCLFIVLATFTAYLFMQNQSLKQQLASLPTPTPLPAEAPAKEGDPTANWKTYTWETLGFSFKYPSDWTYTESAPLQSVSFNTGIPSWAKMSNGNNQVYVFESLVENQVNYEK